MSTFWRIFLLLGMVYFAITEQPYVMAVWAVCLIVHTIDERPVRR